MKREDEKADGAKEEYEGDTKPKNEADDESEMKVVAKKNIERYNGELDKEFGEKLAYAASDDGANRFGAEEISMTHPGITAVNDSSKTKKKVDEEDESMDKLAYDPDQLAPALVTAREGEKEKGSAGHRKEGIQFFLDDEESAKKLAYAPDQLAPAPRRKGDKSLLALFPPSLFVHEEDEEEQREEPTIQQDSCHAGTRPGANRVRGINWDGNDDDDDYTQFQPERIVGRENEAMTDPQQQTEIIATLVQDDPTVYEAVKIVEEVQSQPPVSWIKRNRWKSIVGIALLLLALVTTIVTTTTNANDKVNFITYTPSELPSPIPSLIPSETVLPTRTPSRMPSTSLLPSTSPTIDRIEIFGTVLSTTTKIYISGSSIQGTIPSTIGLLSHLTHLELDNTNLSGQIATEIGYLTKLSHLTLQLDSSADYNGSIPSEIGLLTDLRHLDLARNFLTGQIPTEFGSLTELSYLTLQRNDLTGTIPTEIGALVRVYTVVLSHNDLSGLIPTSLELMNNLGRLILEGNNLSGFFSSEFCYKSPRPTIRHDSTGISCATESCCEEYCDTDDCD